MACIARAGNLAHSQLYTGIEYAKFSDITIILGNTGDSVVDLRAVLILCFEKEFKDRVNEDRTLYFSAL